jgi:uncharacterized protein (DUF1697 family)
MTERVAAFLKGINVGGNKKIDMQGLRRLIAGVGCGNVRTHLQSGNCVFTCESANLGSLGTVIEEAIESEYGFGSRVILRKAKELSAALERDPLSGLADNPSRHLIGFLADAPKAAAARAAENSSTDKDLVRVVGRHLYMWCPDGISASPLFKINFDRVLGTTVTMRNWNTATKVAQLLAGLPS